MFHVVMQGFYLFGIYLILLLLALKLGILLTYKPKDFVYAAKRLFIYHHRYVVRREDFTRWGDYKIILNAITVCLHISLILWILAEYCHQYGVPSIFDSNN